MSKELLKVALKHPEKVASPIAKSLVSAAGSGLGAAGAFKLLSALRPELAEAALWGGTTAGGVLGHDLAGLLARKKIAYARKKRAAMIKEAPYKKEYSLTKNTKKASLSRAAKGAIGLPLGVMGLGAVHPELFGVLPSSLGGHLSDTIGSNILNSLDNLAKPLLGSSSHQLANVGTSLAGLSALGAGAGKLSERVIPIVKAPIARAASPAVAAASAASGISAKKKAAIIAALLASGGGGYLLGKNNSDS